MPEGSDDDYELFEAQLELDGPQVPQGEGGRWRFVPCLESPGNDITRVGEGLTSDQLKWECMKRGMEGAVAVTTTGAIKHLLEPEEAWQRISDDESQGMWVLQGGTQADLQDTDLDPLEGMAVVAQDPEEDFGVLSMPMDEFGGTLQMQERPPQNASVMSHRSAQSAKSGKSQILDSKGRWEQSTVDKLNHAKNLTKQAVRSIVENDQAHNVANKYNSHTGVVKHSIKKKMGRTTDLCKALEDRIESVEDTIRQVGECLFQLQRCHRIKWAPLNVCERRLELRESRPMQEMVKDHCQEALESERSVLAGARGALEAQIDRMKETIVGLDRIHGELREDLQHKRHALRIDRSCLSPRKPTSSQSRTGSAGGVGSRLYSPPTSTTGHEERLVLPQLQDVAHYMGPPSPQGAEPGTGMMNEGRRQETTHQLVNRALRAEEDALRLANDSDALMIQTQRDCAKASNQAQAELARRIEETQMLKKQLEAQIVDMEETIAQTELSMTKTRQALDSHDRPLRALDKQFAARGRRTVREGIRDPVHDEMEGHLETLKKSVRSLTAKFQGTKELLDQLRSSKQQMQEDFRNKVLAQKIDDACIKVTARKAMELDRSDPRGGRCRETPRRKQRMVPSLGLEPSSLVSGLTF